MTTASHTQTRLHYIQEQRPLYIITRNTGHTTHTWRGRSHCICLGNKVTRHPYEALATLRPYGSLVTLHTLGRRKATLHLLKQSQTTLGLTDLHPQVVVCSYTVLPAAWGSRLLLYLPHLSNHCGAWVFLSRLSLHFSSVRSRGPADPRLSLVLLFSFSLHLAGIAW